MAVRGIRGATTAEANERASILAATRELLQAMIEANRVHPDDVASILFTTSPDLNAEYPAVVAREMGWRDAALLCVREMDVPHGVPRCIRILIHWNTDARAADIRHVYLRDAISLRPDRAATSSLDMGRP